MTTEVELKFELDPAARGRFSRSAALCGARPRRLRMASIYFDTPQCDLARGEMALRMRREGRRWMQTLKSGASGAGGLHARDEWEFARPGPELDLALFADTPLAGLDAPETLHQRLVPAFNVDFQRVTWKVSPAPGSTLEVALDSGAVESRGRRELISEVEIECVEGDPGAAFDLANRLLDDVAMRPSAVTKASRGYGLFRRAGLRPRKAKRVALDAAATPLAAARGLVAEGLEHLQANEEGVLRSNAPEFVHQARIALRRLRAALQLFRDVIGTERASAWRGELGDAAAALGRARDWDVFATESLPPVTAAYGDRTLARKLDAAVARRRRREREAAREVLRAPRHARVVLELARWLSSPESGDAAQGEAPSAPLVDFASRIIRKRHKRLIAGTRRLSAMSSEERHQVRIDAKRLRYGVEGLASIFKARRVKRYAQALAALQDALGRANDAATARRLAAELEPPERFAAFAGGWFAARLEGDPALIESLARRISSARRFWRRKPAAEVQ